MAALIILLIAAALFFALGGAKPKRRERGNFFTRFERNLRREITEREDARTDPPNEDFDTQTIEDWRRVRYRQTHLSDYLLGQRDKERTRPGEAERYAAKLKDEEYKRMLMTSMDPSDYETYEEWRKVITYFGRKDVSPTEEANLRRRWIESRKEAGKA